MEQQNIDVVRRGYEAFGRGDMDALLALFDPDIEWTTAAPPDLPVGGTRRGREAVAAFFREVDEMFDIERFEPREFIAQGDQVVVLVDETSRIKATGHRFDFKWAHVFRLRDGKVVSFQEYGDTSALVDDLRSVGKVRAAGA